MAGATAMIASSSYVLLLGCPNCEVGRLARERFWSEGAAYYLAGCLLPFVLVAVTVRLVLLALPREAASTREVASTDGIEMMESK
jgi:hypothetical protein